MEILRREIQTLLFIATAAGIWLIILILRTPAGTHTLSPAIPFFVKSNPVITPPPFEEMVNASSDGTNSLIMQKELKGHSAIYNFFVLDKGSPTKRNVFTKKEGISQSLSIPFNAWSPDDTFFFIKESTPGGINYYVLQASGQNTQYPNITALFAKLYPTYKITDVTGWGGYGLLVVNTKTDQGTPQSFWFEPSSNGFIPLYTYFK